MNFLIEHSGELLMISGGLGLILGIIVFILLFQVYNMKQIIELKNEIIGAAQAHIEILQGKGIPLDELAKRHKLKSKSK